MTATNWNSMTIDIDCAPGNIPRVTVVRTRADYNSDKYEIFVTQEPRDKDETRFWYCQRCRVSHERGKECPVVFEENAKIYGVGRTWRNFIVTAGFLAELHEEFPKYPGPYAKYLENVVRRRVEK